MSYFYITWKRQKTKGYKYGFSEDVEVEHCHEMV